MFSLRSEKFRKLWFKNGKIHRKKGAALEVVNFQGKKTTEWFLLGVRHREDGPALDNGRGFVKYFFQGIEYDIEKTADGQECKAVYENKIVLHSIQDKPAVICNGTKEWYRYGKLHRMLLPAVMYTNGDVEYWVDGKRHRLDGPAVIFGNKQYWFKDGEFIKCIV